MNHAQRRVALESHGWLEMCPGRRHQVNIGGTVQVCAWISGLMHGVARDAWLDVDSGLVMMHGESKDYEFGEFIEALTVKPVVAEPAAKQRTLWGDE